ncbi:MAG TPA: leucyl/phenylalanyl-tRNA--protein transferase [Burkholderiales bacterium]|nr:leucyl/phenylalanyl-tRNA--protein transferase [Burkholderiales bacterium]
MIPWLGSGDPFPEVERALAEPNGLLAAGADLSLPRLLEAYRNGIFPWFGRDQPILWWSPDPRMVLFPAELKVSRSLARTMRKPRFEVRADTAFEEVIDGCRQPRRGESGTWITEEMAEAYLALHRAGFAHSVETWLDGELVGGLYGVALGRAFFGESMFTHVSDASKVALVALARHLQHWGFGVIDCQMNTAHLASFGAREIPRAEFTRKLRELVHYAPVPVPWRLESAIAR